MANPFETDGNAVKTLNGDPISVNSPFEKKGRLVEVLENLSESGGGIPADYEQLKQQVQNLEQSLSGITQSVEFISSAINRLHGDYLDYKHISGGVCLSDNSALPIETGYTMNGEYEFIVKGHTTASGKGCLIGAYQANNARTTMQLLGESKTLQGQWAANKTLTREEATKLGLPENYIYTTQTYKINKNGVFIKQNDDWLQLVENSGYSGLGDSPFIYLLGDRQDHTAYHGVLYYAEILDENKNTLVVFEPAKNRKTGEIVILQSGNIGSVLRPISGNLKEFVRTAILL